VKVGGFDVDGILRGKYVALDKFWGALEEGSASATSSSAGTRPTSSTTTPSVTGWHTGYPDTRAASTRRRSACCPGSRTRRRSCSTSSNDDGSPHPACPRGLLKKVIARAGALGYEPASRRVRVLRLQGDARVAPRQGLPRPRAAVARDVRLLVGALQPERGLCHAILDDMERFDIPIEGCTPRRGPGVYEVAIRTTTPSAPRTRRRSSRRR
jgi:glutamine synthetase